MIDLDTIKNHLRSQDTRFLESPDHPLILVVWTMGDFSVRLEVSVTCNGHFLMLRARDLMTVPTHHARRLEVLEAVATANHTYRFVKFAIDPEDGEVTASGELWRFEDALSMEDFDGLQHQVLEVVKSWVPVVRDIVDGDSSARMAC